MPFIRVFRYKTLNAQPVFRKPTDPPIKRRIEKELLVNTDHISKIEVEYAMPSEGNADDSHIEIEDGLKTPEAIKWYKVFVGSEEVALRSDPNDPVVKVIEEIYNKAIKGRD